MEKGFYDIHTHILPGVDDGSSNLETTKRILHQEYEDGVRVIYATPHYRQKLFETPHDEIISQYEIVKAYAKQIGIRVELGCEYHVHMDMISMIETSNIYTMGNNRLVLIEFSRKHDYSFIKERCYALLSEGFKPIIAHAERYPALNRDIEKMAFLIEMGAYIQVNAESIIGKCGVLKKCFCKKLMERDLIHFIASDVHDMNARRPLIKECAQYLERKMGKDYLEQILVRNPRELIEEGK